MEQAHESDETLMQRVVGGERQALSVLLRRYANSLLTFIRRSSGDHHRSEELFQEVFLSVWSSRRTYRYPKTFRSWLFGIAANKCRAEYRRRTVPVVSLQAPLAAVAATTHPSPVEGAIATETAQLIDSAVMQLPRQQRMVVVLRIWNGFSYAEIAKTLERTESTVRSNMSHGLASIRSFLEPRLR